MKNLVDEDHSNTTIKVSDFLLVAIKAEEKLKHKSFTRIKYFVGQLEHITQTNEYLIKFMKREEGSRFSWPVREDIAVVPDKDIKLKLPQPAVDRRVCFIFSVTFDGYLMG